MFRELSRVSIPLTAKDLIIAFKSILLSRDFKMSLEDVFANWLKVKHVFAISSGRASLYLIMEILKQTSNKRKVIIPAYTCPTVPLAIARAGLTPELCDISLETLNIECNQLERKIDQNTLAIVAVHMCGFPCYMENILEIAKKYKVIVIEDCAQALGAEYAGKKIGTFGDFAFFSLGRGKGFSTYEGGIITTNLDNYAKIITSKASCLKKPKFIEDVLTIAKLLMMMITFHPNLFWVTRKFPLGWGNEFYRMDFSVQILSSFRQTLASLSLKKVTKVIEKRKEKSEYLSSWLEGINGIKIIKLMGKSKPAYPWLPILFDDVEVCEKVYKTLRKQGLGVSKLYTKSLNHYEYLKEIVPQGRYPNAEYVSKAMLTLPTHHYVTNKDLDNIINNVIKCLQR